MRGYQLPDFRQAVLPLVSESQTASAAPSAAPSPKRKTGKAETSLKKESKSKDASRIEIPASQVRLIFGHSAGYCSFPGCTTRNLVPASKADDAVVVGQIAHIHSYKDSGPRANLALTLKQRNRYSNLILLCGLHMRRSISRQIPIQPAIFVLGRLTWKHVLPLQLRQSCQRSASVS
jgi:hypothetical protein